MAKNYMNQRRKRWAVEFILARDGAFCGICGGSISILERGGQEGLTIDHIIPICRGGSNKVENLQLAHAQCNTMKGDLSNETARAYFERQKLTLI